MDIQVSEYINIEKKASELGCSIPSGLTILPQNFDTAKSPDELIYESTTATIRSILRQAGIQETKLEKQGIKIPHRANKSWEWVGPLIYISSSMLSDAALPIGLNLISSYIYDLFKGHPRNSEGTIEFIVETEKTEHGERRYKRLTFKGTPKDLDTIDINKLKQLSEQ